MKLSFDCAYEIGREDERVVFVAKEDCDIGKYIVFSSRYFNVEAKRISSMLKYLFWLPDKVVRKGDRIIIYTKAGQTQEKANQDGTMSYFFYRGNKESCFADTNACVVLMDASIWDSNLVQKTS